MTTPRTRAPLLPAATAGVLAAVLGTCLVLGAYAAVAGGAAVRFGNGPGGLGGLPQLALLADVVLLALPAALALHRRPRLALLVLGGALAVALGYFFFAHAVDPCALGLVAADATLGGAPLCETGSWGTSASTRFHLLEHAVSTGLLLGLYVAALRATGLLPSRVAAPAAR